MDPYALGLLLGDGCITRRRLRRSRPADPELATHSRRRSNASSWSEGRVRLRPTAPGRAPWWRHRREPRHGDRSRSGSRWKHLVDQIRAHALPQQLRRGAPWGAARPPRYRWRPGPAGRAAARVQYTTTSSRLRDDVLFLVRSLGGVAYWRTRPALGRPPGHANGRDVPMSTMPTSWTSASPRMCNPSGWPESASATRAPAVADRCATSTRIEPAGEAETCVSRSGPRTRSTSPTTSSSPTTR